MGNGKPIINGNSKRDEEVAAARQLMKIEKKSMSPISETSVLDESLYELDPPSDDEFAVDDEGFASCRSSKFEEWASLVKDEGSESVDSLASDFSRDYSSLRESLDISSLLRSGSSTRNASRQGRLRGLSEKVRGMKELSQNTASNRSRTTVRQHLAMIAESHRPESDWRSQSATHVQFTAKAFVQEVEMDTGKLVCAFWRHLDDTNFNETRSAPIRMMVNSDSTGGPIGLKSLSRRNSSQLLRSGSFSLYLADKAELQPDEECRDTANLLL